MFSQGAPVTLAPPVKTCRNLQCSLSICGAIDLSFTIISSVAEASQKSCEHGSRGGLPHALLLGMCHRNILKGWTLFWDKWSWLHNLPVSIHCGLSQILLRGPARCTGCRWSCFVDDDHAIRSHKGRLFGKSLSMFFLSSSCALLINYTKSTDMKRNKQIEDTSSE